MLIKKINRLTCLFIILGTLSMAVYYANSFQISLLSTLFLVISIFSCLVLIILGCVKLYLSQQINEEKDARNFE